MKRFYLKTIALIGLSILASAFLLHAEPPYRPPWLPIWRPSPKPTPTPKLKRPAPPPAPANALPTPVLPRPAMPVVPPDVFASPDDTARFLAGMHFLLSSPLAPYTRDPAWQEHSATLEKAFTRLKTRQLEKIHAWQPVYLPESTEIIPVAFYMFSGPDFLYVDQFLPNASTYVLCGTEPVGPAPDALRLTNLPGALGNLQASMNSLLRFSFSSPET